MGSHPCFPCLGVEQKQPRRASPSCVSPRSLSATELDSGPKRCKPSGFFSGCPFLRTSTAASSAPTVLEDRLLNICNNLCTAFADKAPMLRVSVGLFFLLASACGHVMPPAGEYVVEVEGVTDTC